MEKIINEVCNIVIDNSYKNFTSSVYEFNNKNIEDLSRININEIYDEVLIISYFWYIVKCLIVNRSKNMKFKPATL